MKRRVFLLSTGASFSGLGANDRVNIAQIGIGGRGRNHIDALAKIPEARIGAICDADQSHAEQAAQLVLKRQGNQPKTYRRIEEVLKDKEIDAVSIATCNHWHALATVWACQAGKHVYVEKPASHNVWEGRKMVEAARKYNRIVQVGSQSRSLTHMQKSVDLLRQGVIGKVYMAKGICYRRRLSIGHQPDGPVPAGVDFDYWLGPAPMRPFNPNRFHYNWHWFWDTGNGDIGNQGVHQLDIARWGMGKGLPKSVSCAGGKFLYDDDQETPNTQLATYDYGDSQIIFEVRGLPTPDDGSVSARGESFVGNIFFGGNGYMELDNTGGRIYVGSKHELTQTIKPEQSGEQETISHMQNFLVAIKSGKYTDLVCDIEEGHRSAALAHLANISYRTGRKLTVDGSREQFTGDSEANALLTRKYRRPYVVPDKV